jgi:hypothetical protein
MSTPPVPVNWFKLHPKVKALAIGVAVLILGSIPTALNGTVSWKEAATADITAAVALLIAYLGPANPKP